MNIIFSKEVNRPLECFHNFTNFLKDVLFATVHLWQIITEKYGWEYLDDSVGIMASETAS